VLVVGAAVLEVLCGFVVSTVDNLVDEVKVEDDVCVNNFVVELGVGTVLEIVVEVLGLTMDRVVVVCGVLVIGVDWDVMGWVGVVVGAVVKVVVGKVVRVVVGTVVRVVGGAVVRVVVVVFVVD